MVNSDRLISLLARFSKAENARIQDALIGSRFNLSSIGFTEFIMELEEESGLDIDIDGLDASINMVQKRFDFPAASRRDKTLRPGYRRE